MRRVGVQGAASSSSNSTRCCPLSPHLYTLLPPTLCVPSRAASLIGWLNKLPFSDPPSRTMTSEDIYRDNSHASRGYNPVLALDHLLRVTGPLRRRHVTKPEDYLNVDETRQWMNAKQAAKVLQIAEADLPLLTREKLEQKWRALYAVRSHAAQEEVLIATEVLLEYLDSGLYVKHNRRHYRDVVENARLAIDAELQAQRRGVRQIMLYAFVVLLCLGSVIVVVMAVVKHYVRLNDDVNAMEQRVADYMTLTFMQSKNVEPAPDYNTRYFLTPSAMTAEEQAGRAKMPFLASHTAEQLRQKAEYEEAEAAEMLRLVNDEHEQASRERVAEDLHRSRVPVLQQEQQLQPAKESTMSDAHEAEKAGGDERGKKPLEEQLKRNATNYRAFVSVIAHNHGLASRFQRLTDAATEQGEQKRAIAKRLQEEEEEEQGRR